MKAKKFTFKTEKPTGRYKSFYPNYNMIKLEGKQVGNIDDKSYKIHLHVLKADIMEDGNPNCIFKNVTLKHQSLSVDGAKIYLNNNFDRVLKLNLHQID